MERNQVSHSNSGLGSSRNDAARLDTLPEDCISMVVYHTSPRDACVLASVSKTVNAAAESDLVWEKFLPTDYSSLVVPRSFDFSSKKEMYMSLADDPVLIDDGKKSFWLEKSSGKKCYMLSAMDMNIAWIDTPAYWKWKKDPESKFEKVAELRSVCWFEIRGKISCGMLSKGTHYSVYAVLKIARNGSCGLDDTPMEAQVDASTTLVLLEPRRSGGYRYSSVSPTTVFREVISSSGGSWMRIPVEEDEGEREAGENVLEVPKERGDGWSEVTLGNFYIKDGGCDDDDGEDEIEFSVVETQKGNLKSGLIFQGIEIRPMKEGEMVIAK